MWPQVVQSLDLDFIFIDTEHIPIGREKLAWMCQVYQAMSIAPLVRIPNPDPFEASMALDGGAAGIIIPYIETAEQVKIMAGAVKYNPLKGSKLSGFLETGIGLKKELLDYLGNRNSDKLLIINIESVSGMEALPEILKIEELDAVLIGPHDLSCSLGIPEQYDHPGYWEAVDRIIRTTRKAGKGAGVHNAYNASIEEEITWIESGANLVMCGADLISFRKDIGSRIQSIRKAVGDGHSPANGESINI
jgi:4-hydroxy-2-oxoheptanedioate aldolase